MRTSITKILENTSECTRGKVSFKWLLKQYIHVNKCLLYKIINKCFQLNSRQIYFKTEIIQIIQYEKHKMFNNLTYLFHKKYVILTVYLLSFLFQNISVLSALIYLEKLRGTTNEYLKGLMKCQYFFFTIWTYVSYNILFLLFTYELS